MSRPSRPARRRHPAGRAAARAGAVLVACAALVPGPATTAVAAQPRPALPAGLAIDRTTGTVAGTPTTAGTSTSTVTATDSAGRTASATFTWTVAAPACTAGERLADGGFESGGTGWAASPGVVVRGDSTRPPRTGAWIVRLGGRGTTATTTLTQDVTVPAGCSTYRLTF